MLGRRRPRRCGPPATFTPDQSPPSSHLVTSTRCRLSGQRGSGQPSVSIPTAGPPSADVELVRPRIEQFVAASDIVKASDEDLLWLYPDRTPLEALEAWLDLGPAVVALTRGGAAGPVILTRQVRVEMPAVSVVVADTVGGGGTRLWQD